MLAVRVQLAAELPLGESNKERTPAKKFRVLAKRDQRDQGSYRLNIPDIFCPRVKKAFLKNQVNSNIFKRTV